MVFADEQIKTILLNFGLVDEKGLTKLTESCAESGLTLKQAAIDKGLVSEEQLGQLIANFLNIPFVNLSKISIPEDVLKIIPERIARKKRLVSFARNNEGIDIAVSDIPSQSILRMISKKIGGQKIVFHLATASDIANTFRLYKKDLQTTIDELLNEAKRGTGALTHNDVPVIKIIEVLVQFAFQTKSSDIHIEPQEKIILVRFRIDGVLHDMLKLPKNLHDQIITRLKVLAKLRTDEHLAPQDGKIRMNIKDEEENIDIRISIVPTVDGEKTVARILVSQSRQLTLSELGFNQNSLAKINNAISKPYGMILSTGPTGAGKTTAIYSILKILNTREKNITTIEDPVEYKIKGVNQIQVNTKTNLTFASGLRSILRQDPNIVFVGEIRDNETAAIAVNAALTGHLVLSTLHTNDSATALPRLTDMDIEPFLVASTVNVIIAQRLVRKICDMCRNSQLITREDLLLNIPKALIVKNFGDKNDIRIFKGSGCKFCHYTGYSGRIGVFEVLEVSKKIKRLLIEKSDSDIILRQAIEEGMNTMLDDGLRKAAKGLTTIEEVLRVTKVETI